MRFLNKNSLLVVLAALVTQLSIGQVNIAVDGNSSPSTLSTGAVGTSTVNPTFPPTSGNYAGQQSVEVKPNSSLAVSTGQQVHLYLNPSLTPLTNYGNIGSTGIDNPPPSDINTTLNTSGPCYKTPTSYGVTPQGAATYSVPIYAPPGTMGIVPNLSIAYNSMSQNGLLGYGWSLSGILSISRSSQSIYNAGQVQSVTLTNSDYFTYNGSILIVTGNAPGGSGLNGADGTYYHTEEESFNQITSMGTLSNGNGPDYFTVQTKDGLTYEFGNTTDSKLIPVGQETPAVLTWMIDKVSDAYGNYMTFTYNNTGTGEVNISEIDYTGNSQSGKAPYNAIKFTYDKKTDANTIYVAGGSVNSSVILNNIEVTSEGSFVKQYNFAYYYYDVTTLLASITEQGADYSKLNPIQFAYTSDDVTDPIKQTSSISYNYPASSCSGFTGRQFEAIDFNGDGKKDLISFVTCAGTQGAWDDYISDLLTNQTPPNLAWVGWEALENASTNSSSLFTPGSELNAQPASGATPFSLTFPLNPNTPGAFPNNIYDFNGDGKEDLAFEQIQSASDLGITLPYGSNYQVNIFPYLSQGTNFSEQSPLPAYLNIAGYNGATDITNSNILFADLNGDHKMDVINYIDNGSTGTFQIWFDATNPSLSASPSTPGTNTLISNISMNNGGTGWDFSQAFAIDRYGDDRTEIVNILGPGGGLYVLEYQANNSNSYTVGGNGTPNSGVYPIWYLGYGLVLKADNSGVNYDYTVSGNSPRFYNVYGDFNGDGVTDILQFPLTGSNPKWTEYLGKGTGAYATGIDVSSIITESPNTSLQLQFYAVDMNGDGKSDIVSTGVHGLVVYASTGNSFSVLSSYGYPSSYKANATQVLFGDFDGDGTNDIMFVNTDVVPEVPQIIYSYKGSQSRRMSEAVDGYNVKTQFAYQTLTNLPAPATGITGSTYTQTLTPSYPLNDFKGPTYVATQLTVPDEAGGSSVTTYSYKDGIEHMAGKGFIGFMGFTASNPDVNYVITNNFAYDPTYFNLLSTNSSKSTYTGVSISYDTYSYSENTYSSNVLRNWVRLENTVHHDLVTGGTTTTTYRYTNSTDGNVKEINTASDIVTKDVQYSNFVSLPLVGNTNWWIDAKPQTVVTTLSRVTSATGPPDSREVDYTYAQGGAVATVTTDPNATYTTGYNASTVTTYSIDPQSGKKTSQSVLSYDPITGVSQTITTNYNYDANNRFVINTGYPYSEFTSATYDNKWGTSLSVTGADGLTTTSKYDGYGRAVSVTTPDGLTATSSYNWYTGGLPLANDPIDVSSFALYSVLTQKPGSPSLNTYYDMYNNEIRTEKDGFSNKLYAVKTYNARGKASEQSNTYETVTGTAYKPILTEFFYNDDNTLDDTKTTDLGTSASYYTTYHYAYSVGGSNGNAQITTNTPDGKTDVKIMDASGLLFQETDNIGNTMTYVYAQNGKLDHNQTATGEGVLYGYDAIDNPKSLYEFNSGLTKYQYNSIGQLISQTDANNNTYTMTYDLLGRKTAKLNDNECGANGNQVIPYTYSYNNTGTAVNKVYMASTPCGVVDNYSFDNLGRPNKTTETVNGQTFITKCTYDQFSNVSEKMSPDGFGVLNSYNSFGYLTETQREDNQDAIWQAVEMNPMGQYTKYILGTGTAALETDKDYNNFGMATHFVAANSSIIAQDLTFTFDIPTGNLTNRTDESTPTNLTGNVNMSETFTYDNLDRLTGSTEFNTSTFTSGPSTSTAYDNQGNITSNSNAGSYTYAQINYPSPSPINAVVSVTNPNGLIQSPPQNITYTPFKEVSTICENNATLTFIYGADMMRKETDFTDATNSMNNYSRYFSGSYEKTVYTNQSSTDEVDYINCGGILVAMHVKQTQGSNPSTENIYNVYTDHLGSILTLTDANNSFVAKQNFDAWGNYRDPDTWTPINTTTNYPYNYPTNNPRWLYRGYTGHEHLKEFGLINMNARLYDPLLGRMLSPDPMVGDGNNNQNYNMYSYCLNNPLKSTDPTGMISGPYGVFNPYAAQIPANSDVLYSIYGYAAGPNLYKDINPWLGTSVDFYSNYSGGYAFYYTQSGGLYIVQTPWMVDNIFFTQNASGGTFSPDATPNDGVLSLAQAYVNSDNGSSNANGSNSAPSVSLSAIFSGFESSFGETTTSKTTLPSFGKIFSGIGGIEYTPYVSQLTGNIKGNNNNTTITNGVTEGSDWNSSVGPLAASVGVVKYGLSNSLSVNGTALNQSLYFDANSFTLDYSIGISHTNAIGTTNGWDITIGINPLLLGSLYMKAMEGGAVFAP